MHACEGEAVCKLTNAKVRRETLERTPPLSLRDEREIAHVHNAVSFVSLRVRPCVFF